MIAKKSKNADLEKKRFAFLQIGFVVAGALVLSAFQFGNPKFATIDQNSHDNGPIITNPELPDMEIIYQAKPKPKQTFSPIVEEVKEVKKVVKTSDGQVNDDLIKELDIFDDGTGDKDGEIVFTDPTKPFIVVEEWPEFPGGDAKMQQFINENFEVPHYAEHATGTIYVRFVVAKDGTITNASILKGIQKEYDKAALAVVSKMPKWKPGKQAGKNVNVQYEIPIKIIGG
ncbi:MAG: energy transducer TonB [Putridiphycobacter sp.]